MASKATQGWCELQRISQDECPKLFYNVGSLGNGLQLVFTDLLGIWECTLEKSDILKTAQEQHTSIDPSESTAQLQVLLEKLQQGIRSHHNVLYRGKGEELQDLYLQTFVELPKPLQPLVWTFKLVPQQAVELGEQLLRPCLFEASLSRQKLASLQQVIKDKDHVISRLLEKLEGSNTDLGLIFPGVKSRRGRVTTSEAEKHVPGMAPFNTTAWSSYFDTSNPYASYDTKSLDNLVSGCQECPKHTAREHSQWYKHLPDSANASLAGNTTVKQQSKSFEAAKSEQEDGASTSEDEFERQRTPPHLREELDHQQSKASPGSRDSSSSTTSQRQTDAALTQRHKPSQDIDQKPIERSNPNTKLDRDNSTEEDDDDDLDAPSQKSTQKRARSEVSSSGTEQEGNNQRKVTKLGGLKKGKYQPATRSPSPAKHESHRRRLGTLKKPTNSNKPDVNEIKDTSRQEQQQQHNSPAPSRRLGRLGKKKADHKADDSDDMSNEPSNTSNDKTEPRHKESTRNKKDVDSDATASPTPSPSPSADPTPTLRNTNIDTIPNIKSENVDQTASTLALSHEQEQQVELTAEEKANQRREELKRKVDVGAGTRKKRKF